MRILLVTSEVFDKRSPAGGLANFINRFSRALINHGHQVRILSYGEAASDVVHDGVITTTVATRGPKWMTALDMLTFRAFAPSRTILFRARSVANRVSDLIREEQADIVQYSNLEALSLFHPGGVPSVVRYSSDTLLVRDNGGYDLESRSSIRQRHFLECRAALAADAIYAPSLLTADVVSRRLNRPVDLIRPPVFLVTDDLDPSVLESSVGSAPFLLFVGTINKLKGIPILTEIIHSVLDRHPDLHFVVAGREGSTSGPRSLKGALTDAAGDHANRIFFPGVLPKKQMVPFLKAARAVVLPSLIDNLPNTMLEGMLHGSVVIGTRGASFDELISDGVNGLLCERRDSKSLLDAIERALDLDVSARTSMGAAAQKRVSELRPEIVIPHTVAYFESVIEAAGPRSHQMNALG